MFYSGRYTLLQVASFQTWLLNLKETNIAKQRMHNRLKNPNWREAGQMAIYKHDMITEELN